MSLSPQNELTSLSLTLSKRAALENEAEVVAVVEALKAAVRWFSEAWSGSSLGFHACVYYADFKRPPGDAHFSAEWGFLGEYHGTQGDWNEHNHEDVVELILAEAGNPNLERLEEIAQEARETFHEAKADIASVHHAYVQHQGRLQAIANAFFTCGQLARIAERSRRHIERVEASAPDPQTAPATAPGDKVFIGHGRSQDWRVLKDFVGERLHLPYDEFNRVATAGRSTVERLAEMLDQAAIAFLVLTAEDETAEKTFQARQNVVHEVGLFQGRLGFAKAIVLLEEGCSEFSNIHGLTQLRFPKDNIAGCFEEVRRVREREGL